MQADEKPKVLLVYYTYTQQTGRVAEAMAEALTARGCEVTKALIEFTDARRSKLFSELPMRLPALRIPTILPAQRLRHIGEIRIPPEAQDGEYDLVVIGGPTWWLTTNMPVRSYLHDDAAKAVLDGTPFAAFSVSRRYWKGNVHTIKALGERAGGTWQGETHFLADGNQVMSMWSWLAFMRHNEPRERSLGKKMPRPNLKADFADQARKFAGSLVDRLTSASTQPVR